MKGRTHAIVASATMVSIAVLNWNSNSILGVEVIPALTIPTAIVGGLKADFEVGSGRGKMEHPILARILTHRGLTHTGIIPCALYGLTYSLTVGDTTLPIKIVSSLMFGFFVGYATHLLATDLFNRKGVPLLWPIFPKRFHLMSITTSYNRKRDGKKVGALQESLFLLTYLALLLVHTISLLGGWVL